MKCKLLTISGAALLGLGLALRSSAEDKKPDLSKLPPAATGTMDFSRDIAPILVRSCVNCHGSAKQKGGLRLDSLAETNKGGDSGVVLKAGDANASRLIHLVGGVDPESRMPPDKQKALAPEEIGKLRAWIDQGAKWPSDLVLQTKDGPKTTHWSFQPIRRPPFPMIGDAAWVQRNGIDNFVQARLEKEKIAPAPEAERMTLIRRLYLDLLGLPPSPAEIDVGLSDKSPDWYEKLVDRLLDSPHFGERWGRHWLDLARYADSDGFEKDSGRPFAWRWRQWVIDSLNRDMPFDQFSIEQLAGDLLPKATLEQKVATGFHRNTLTNREGGVDQEQFRVEAVVDRVSTTAKVWLGITMNCCQCHDHKYDPFSQREFYQFFAFFNNDVETDIPAALPQDVEAERGRQEAFDKKKAELKSATAAYTKEQLPSAQEKWEADLKLPELRKLTPALREIVLIEPKARNDKQKKELGAFYATIDKELVKLTKAARDHERTGPAVTKAQTLAIGGKRKTHVMIRGDFLRPGAEVEANTPAVVAASAKGRGSAPATRLELAKWIVDPANPLTARVIVNWMWQKYFGRGIVVTLEDFGTQGEKPSHPELLDWLASEFVRQQWSMKAMHRLIVTSATYRQSSRYRSDLATRDPLNILLARQGRQRLEAEVLRDVSLATSGLLNRTIGGPSVRPPQPAGISELTYAGSARWVESTGADRYRRGLYTWFQRTSPYPMLMTFDSPDGVTSCVRREKTNTPLQALTLLNDSVFVECAQSLGKRILEEKSIDTKDRLQHAFKVTLAREPSGPEMERLARLFNDLQQMCKSKPEEAAKLVGKMKVNGVEPAEAAAWIALARTLMNLDEFVTRE